MDGGTAYSGAEITPFYDSLLVKIIAHDRDFGTAVHKSIRALKETRIRGVKTNIPFLINVLANPIFMEGEATTTFIENTPELFEISLGMDRATKIAEFIGNKIVNEAKGDKPVFDKITAPKVESSATHGARDEVVA